MVRPAIASAGRGQPPDAANRLPDEAVSRPEAQAVEAERAFRAAPVVLVRGPRMSAATQSVLPRIPDHRTRMLAVLPGLC